MNKTTGIILFFGLVVVLLGIYFYTQSKADEEATVTTSQTDQLETGGIGDFTADVIGGIAGAGIFGGIAQ